MDIHQAITASLAFLHEHSTATSRWTASSANSAPISCAPARMNQLFFELLNNAIQAIEATSQGGRIEIRTHADGDRVVVRLTDDGCGIPAEGLPRIFDPFFTTRPVGAGKGQA